MRELIRLHLRQRVRLSEGTWVLILAPLIGLGAGVGVFLFRRAVDGVQDMLRSLTPGGWIRILAPVLGGLLIAGMTRFFLEREEMPGVSGLILAMVTAGGRLPYWRMPAKAVAAILSLGVGASVGPEDPSVQIGAHLGSGLAQRVRLSEESIRLLTAAGAAGGIAAAFNAPIAGVLFAAEILLGEFATAPITAMVLATVSATLATQVLLGPYPAFLVPAYSFRHPLELPFYLLLGVLAAGVAILYIRLLYGMRLAVERLPLPPWLRTPAGGLVLGLLGLLAPQVLGVGYDSIQTILQGQPHNPILVLEWMFLKLVLTPLSLAVGFVGGVFAPALFLGAMLGYAYGATLGSLFPAWVADPSAYAMVAMVALLAGAIHAPFTATLLLFEMTRDYRIILPLMAAVSLSALISERLQPGSLYTEALRQRGLRLARGRDVDVLESLRVEEAMNPDVVRATQTLPAQAALEILLQRRRRTLIVETPEGTLWGITTLRDLEMALTAGRGGEPVGQICQRPVITIFPDEPVSEAVRRMSEWNIGQVPVVSREDPQRVIGIVRREEVVRAYDLALTRKRLLQYQLEQIRLRTLSGMKTVELPVEADAPAVGRPLSELPWPPECRIAVVRRGAGTLIPNGELTLQAGDRVVLLGKPEAIREAWRMFQRANHEAGPST